jgi:excinuclease ABC subunit C
MKDRDGQVIYIGKAKNLRKRLSSYYWKDCGKRDWKSIQLIKKVASIEIMMTDSEIEAFLLESNLIKQYRPLYNIELKDQQRFTYLRISDETFPRLLVTRRNRAGKIKGQTGRIFGPFVRGSSKFLTVGLLRKIFKIRICDRLPKYPCLEYFIKNCDAPCIGNVTQYEYMRNVNALASILSGNKTMDEFIRTMTDEMKLASSTRNYEKAREIRDTIKRLDNLRLDQKMERLDSSKFEEYVGMVQDPSRGKAHVLILQRRSGVISDRKKFEFDLIADNSLSTFLSQYYSSATAIPYTIYTNLEPDSKCILEQSIGRLAAHRVRILKISTLGKKEKNRLMNLIIRNLSAYIEKGFEPSLAKLRQILEMDNVPKTIDCFDVSNLGSSIMVGSCVRFFNGSPDKSRYRRFRIKTIIGQNDFGMIREIVKRRYSQLIEASEKPDLILIDGGKGQLNAAISALNEIQLKIPCVSLAKDDEAIYTSSSSLPIILPKNNGGLQILQSVRDEAHRFALSYNIKLRV